MIVTSVHVLRQVGCLGWAAAYARIATHTLLLQANTYPLEQSTLYKQVLDTPPLLNHAKKKIERMQGLHTICALLIQYNTPVPHTSAALQPITHSAVLYVPKNQGIHW
jgi:hypothetical protein